MSAKFQQRMENLLDEYFVANLPKLTSFLRENKYCEYNGPRVIPSAADYCNQFAPGHNMSTEKQEKMWDCYIEDTRKNHAKYLQQLHEEKHTAFALILSHCDAACQSSLQAIPDYLELKRLGNDPLELWRLIVKIQSRQTYLPLEIQYQSLMKDHFGIRQAKDETLGQFRQRFLISYRKIANFRRAGQHAEVSETSAEEAKSLDPRLPSTPLLASRRETFHDTSVRSMFDVEERLKGFNSNLEQLIEERKKASSAPRPLSEHAESRSSLFASDSSHPRHHAAQGTAHDLVRTIVKTVWMPPVTETEASVGFIMGLDRDKFGSLQESLLRQTNEFQHGMPPDVETAYAIARQFETNTLSTANKADNKNANETSAKAKNGFKKRDKNPETKSDVRQDSKVKKDDKKERSPPDYSKPPTTECRACAEAGYPGQMHWRKFCPITQVQRMASKAAAKKADSNIAVTAAFFVAPEATKDHRYVIRLDNCSSISVIKDVELLQFVTNLAHPFQLHGISVNEEVLIKQCGYLPGIGPVYYAQNASVNILSYYELLSRGAKFTHNNYEVKMKINSFTMDFHGESDHTCVGFYTQKTNTTRKPISTYVTTNLKSNNPFEAISTDTDNDGDNSFNEETNSVSITSIDEQITGVMHQQQVPVAPTTGVTLPQPQRGLVTTVHHNLSQYSKDEMGRATKAMELSQAL